MNIDKLKECYKEGVLIRITSAENWRKIGQTLNNRNGHDSWGYDSGISCGYIDIFHHDYYSELPHNIQLTEKIVVDSSITEDDRQHIIELDEFLSKKVKELTL